MFKCTDLQKYLINIYYQNILIVFFYKKITHSCFIKFHEYKIYCNTSVNLCGVPEIPLSKDTHLNRVMEKLYYLFQKNSAKYLK